MPDLLQQGEPRLDVLPGVDSDESLAARAVTDAAALTELYQRYLPRVYHYCRCRLESDTQVEDATAQIFLHVVEGLAGRRVDNVRSWIFTIAHNEVVSIYRKRRPLLGLDWAASLVSRDRSPEDIAVELADERDVLALLERLNRNERAVVELRLFGLTGPEIAEHLGRSYTWVGTTQHRAYARLRTLVETERAKRGEA